MRIRILLATLKFYNPQHLVRIQSSLTKNGRIQLNGISWPDSLKLLEEAKNTTNRFQLILSLQDAFLNH